MSNTYKQNSVYKEISRQYTILLTFKNLIVMKYKTIKLGFNNSEPIYLYPPKWEERYWSFGNLGNINCHYHLIKLEENCNLYDGIKKHFGDSFIIKNDKDLWTICELFVTAYSLKDIAEVYNRGGAHYSKNPCAELIKNESEVKRINEVLLPAIFEEIYKLFE